MELSDSICTKAQLKGYNSLIGGLQYLSNNTRPDIAHTVNHLARFLINPSDAHIQAARRLLHYLVKDPDMGILYKSGKDRPVLEAFSSVDFAGDPSTSRSTFGSLIKLSSGPVGWKSHLQREVVLSTTEAEYLAATETYFKLLWVKSLLEELNLSDRIEGGKITKLHVDDQSAISLIKNHVNHKRTKHIALRNSFCRQKFQNGDIEVIHVQSNQQLADSLTKANSVVSIQ